MSQNSVTWWQILSVVITILLGTISIITTIFVVAWKLRGYFSKIELGMAEHKGAFQTEMAATREVMMALHRRVERVENKLEVPQSIVEKYKPS
jgi:hypothetical protein